VSTKEFRENGENIELNRRLTYLSTDKNFEKLLVEVNGYLEKAQLDKIRYMRRENEIRQEIENISHDLRTPLTSILGYLELMDDEDLSEKEKEEYLSIIERRAKGLHKLVQTFYDVSRLEANGYKMNIEKVDINKELKENILLFYNDFENKCIDVEIELLNEELYVEADKNDLDRIFTNLLQNAIKYSKSIFKVSLEKVEDKVVIIFSNNTEGVSEEEFQCLFNRFYMKDTSRNNSSSGLGLTVTKLLIEEMGGEIKAEIKESGERDKAEVKEDWIRFTVIYPACYV